jgi:transcriptional regulator with XRE-family HTH domain
MTNFRALPSTAALPETLAERVRYIREYRNLTVKDLSRASRFPLKRIEDIESGLETWFSATDRQLLCRALAVDPSVLQEVERRSSHDVNQIPQETINELGDDILHGARGLLCPSCGSNLRCSVQEAFDMDGHPMQLPKAYCVKCPFVLRY